MKAKKNKINKDNNKELERYITLKSVLHTKHQLAKLKSNKEFKRRLRGLKALSIVNHFRLFGHFLLWIAKLLLPNFLMSSPSLWDNLKTLKKDPSFKPFRMAILAWIIFSIIFIFWAALSLINASKIFAAANYDITVNTIDTLGNNLNNGQVFVDGITNWVSAPYLFNSSSQTIVYSAKWGDWPLQASSTLNVKRNKTYRVNALTGVVTEESTPNLTQVLFEYDPMEIYVKTIDAEHSSINGQVKIDNIVDWTDTGYFFTTAKEDILTYYGKWNDLSYSKDLTVQKGNIYKVNVDTEDYEVVDSTDGSTAVEFLFTTIEEPQEELSIFNVATTIGTTSIDIGWETNLNASSQILYGLTIDYMENTIEVDADFRFLAHIVSVTNLNPCTVYYFKIRSVDDLQNEAYSTDYVFSTLGCIGDSEIIAQNQDIISPETGGSLTLIGDNNAEIVLDIPVDFSASSSVFKIQQMDEVQILNTIGSPQEHESAGNFYQLQAFSDIGEEITSFNNNVSVTINYTSSDVVGIDEQSLKIFRWSGGSWSELSNCSVDTTLKKVTCETPGFSIFGVFGQEQEPEEEAEEQEDEEIYDNEEDVEESVVTPKQSSGGGGGIPLEAYNLSTPPQGGFSVKINNGDKYTNSRIVNLSLNAGDDITKMVVSNKADLGNDGQEAYQKNKLEWDICASSGGALKMPTCPEGNYKVYAKFYTKWGRVSEIVFDDILYRQIVATTTLATTSKIIANEIKKEELIAASTTLASTTKEKIIKKPAVLEESFKPKVVVVKKPIVENKQLKKQILRKKAAPLASQKIKSSIALSEPPLPQKPDSKLVLKSVRNKVIQFGNKTPSYNDLKNISKELSSINFFKDKEITEELYTILESEKNNKKYLRNKYLDLQSALDLNSVLLDTGGQDSVYSVWYTFGSLVVNAVIVNPTNEKSVIPFSTFLPKEVEPSHIVSTGGLKFEYNDKAQTYMLAGDFDLAAGDSVMRKVKIKDAWKLDKYKVENLINRTNELYLLGKKNKLNERILAFKNNIIPQLHIIKESEDNLKFSPQDHIIEFRKNEQKIEQIERYLDEMVDLVIKPKVSTRMYMALGSMDNKQILLLLGIILISGLGLLFAIMFKVWKNQLMVMANNAILKKTKKNVSSALLKRYEIDEKKTIIKVIIVMVVMIILMCGYLAWQFGLI